MHLGDAVLHFVESICCSRDRVFMVMVLLWILLSLSVAETAFILANIFHHPPDLCLADGGKGLESPVVSYSP